MLINKQPQANIHTYRSLWEQCDAQVGAFRDEMHEVRPCVHGNTSVPTP